MASAVHPAIKKASDISGSLQTLAASDNVRSPPSLAAGDTVDITQLDARTTDLQSELQLVLDQHRSHKLINGN